MKLLLDMNIPLKYAHLLTAKGFDVLSWSDIGVIHAADAEIMAYARANEYVVLTFDLDFSAILSATNALKPSVVQIRVSIPHAGQVVDLIAAAMLKYSDDLASGAVLSINMKKARIRLLPL